MSDQNRRVHSGIHGKYHRNPIIPELRDVTISDAPLRQSGWALQPSTEQILSRLKAFGPKAARQRQAPETVTSEAQPVRAKRCSTSGASISVTG